MNPIFPSILSTNFFNLESRLHEFASNNIDFIHLDVMDGHFVDNISFGPGTIPAIRSRFDFQFDAHLMVSNPEKMITKYIESGSDWVSFHIEVNHHIKKNIEIIKNHGKKAGMVLNPDTPIEKVFPYLPLLDYVLLMSVFPGYGGQKFLLETENRVRELKSRIAQEGLSCLIQVDGGINDQNIHGLKKAGADLFVIGTHLFNSSDIKITLNTILNQISGD